MQKTKEIINQLEELKTKSSSVAQKKVRPGKVESLGGFFNNGAVSLRFIFHEKENIVFALLQLVVIGIMYFLWAKSLSFIPEDYWRDDNTDDLVSVIVLLWSFVLVGIATFPLGLLTACMCASYLLHFEGRDSTVAECLKIVLPKSWSIWIFSWFDGWWTAWQILERLPKKNDKTPLTVKLAHEAAYQAWKLASLGVIPSLLSGNGIAQAAKNSISLLSSKFSMLAKLRLGYSLICWIFGIGTYLSMFFLIAHLSDVPAFATLFKTVSGFYLFAGIPTIVALVFVMLIFRPIYIISACRIYAFNAREHNQPILLPEPMPRILSAFVFFVALVIIVFVAWQYVSYFGGDNLLNLLPQ